MNHTLSYDITMTPMMVTPDLAKKWLKERSFSQQRNIRPAHVAWLVNLMCQPHETYTVQAFRPGTELTFAVYKEKHVLVNGYHRLHAVIAYGKPVFFFIKDHPVASEYDIAALYGQFDRELRRTAQDVYNAHDFSKRSGLTRTQIGVLSACLPYLCSGFADEPGRDTKLPTVIALKDPELRLQGMQTWAEEARRYFSVQTNMTTLNKGCLKRAAVAAIALVTFRYTLAKATLFWGQVARDEGLSTGMPAKTLLRFLHDTPTLVKRFSYARYIATAWNAFYENRALTILRAGDISRPLTLAGTPHRGMHIMAYFKPPKKFLHDPIVFKKDMP